MTIRRIAVSTALVLGVLLALIGTAEATNYPFNQLSPAAAGFRDFRTLNPSWTGSLGYRFTVNAANMTVTHLGRANPSGQATDVRLWNMSSGQLGQVTTSTSTGGAWAFAALTTPVLLTQNTDYIVSVFCGGGGDYYIANFPLPAAWLSDSNITLVGGREQNGTAPAFPAATSSSYMGGVADIGYLIGPPAPATLTVPGSDNDGNYTVNWTSSTGATGYDLEEDTSGTFPAPTLLVNNQNVTTFNVTGRANGTYFYRVRARNSIGFSGWTNGSTSCVVTHPPPVPTNLIVPSTSITGNYTVTWNAAATATGYDLEEDTNNTFPSPTLVVNNLPVLSFNVTGKTTGTFYYRVRARNVGGFSNWVNGPNGCLMVPPAVPTWGTVPSQSATGNYTVSWNASTSATGYDLEEDTSSGFSSPTLVASNQAGTTFNVTGKTSGTFYYRVRSRGPAGPSSWANGPNGCLIVPPPAPTWGTVPTQSVTGNYTVSWNASTGATGYDLEEDTTTGFTNPTLVASNQAGTTFNVTGKTTGTFYYRVRAVNGAGSSGWVPGPNGCQIVAPAAPASMTVPLTSVTGSYTVSWIASTGATAYDLEEDTSAAFTNPTLVSTAGTSFNVTGKTSGTFFYRVRANNGAGSSGWTPGPNGCLMIPPVAPTPLTVPAASSTGNYAITWGASTGANSYELQEDTTSGFGSAVTISNAASLNFAVTGKTNGTYYYRVRAVNGAGQSPWTLDLVGCIVSLTPPTAPTTVTVPLSSSTGNIVVTWTSVAGAWTYDVEEAVDSGFTTGLRTVYSGALTSAAINGLADGIYFYRVRAVNVAGQSAWTLGGNSCTVLRLPPPAPGFINVPATSSDGSIPLNWGTSSGATLYTVEESTDSSFASTTVVYTGTGTSTTLSGRTDGIYYYRVSASNAVGSSAWTNGTGCTVTVSTAALVVSAGPGNPGPSNELPGATGVTMIQIRLSAGSFEDVRLGTLVLHGSGTGDDAAEVTQVTLYRDNDTNGLVGPADSFVAMDTFSGNNGTVTFDLSSEPSVTASGEAFYLAAANFAAGAATGGTFTQSMTPGSDLGATGATTSNAVTPSGSLLSGGPKTLATSGAGSLQVTDETLSASTATRPSSAVVLNLLLSASSLESVNLSRIDVSSQGTGNEAGLSARLVLDADGNGVLSTGDTDLATGTFALDNGTVTFSGLIQTVPAGGSEKYLVVFDFTAASALGTYIGLLETTVSVEAVGGTSSMGIVASGLPLTGQAVTLIEVVEGEPAFFMGGCSAGPSGPSGLAFALLLLAFVLLAFRVARRVTA